MLWNKNRDTTNISLICHQKHTIYIIVNFYDKVKIFTADIAYQSSSYYYFPLHSLQFTLENLGFSGDTFL